MAKQNESGPAIFQKLPSIDTLLKEPELEGLIAEVGRQVVVETLRGAVEQVRQLLVAKPDADMDQKEIYRKIIDATKNS